LQETELVSSGVQVRLAVCDLLKTVSNLVGRLVASGAPVLLFSLFQFPFWWQILFTLFFVCLSLFFTLINLAIFSSALSVAFVFAGTILLALFPDESLYYREHEKLIQRHGRYRANSRETIVSPHGDFLAIAPDLPRDLAEPRVIRFQSDQLGYRNRKSYDHQAYILNGDSFVAGTGLSQEVTLGEQLLRVYGMPNYSIAVPSDPLLYDIRALQFIRDHVKADFVFAHFFFEGNDFVSDVDTSRRSPSRAYHYYSAHYHRWLESLWGSISATTARIGQISFALGARAESAFSDAPDQTVELAQLGGHPFGILSSHKQAAKATKLSLPPTKKFSRDVWEKTDCIFFIPTSARVYGSKLEPAIELEPGTPPGVLALKSWIDEMRLDSPPKIVDLTPALFIAAEKNLSSGSLVFRRDDTHWNEKGIEAVLPEVYACLTGH
jgi:hypothetical protein